MCAKLLGITFVVALFVAFVKVEVVTGGATEQQLRARCKLMREVCLPKFPKVSREMANRIRSGDIPDSRDAKCYINCVLEKMQTMKKGKFLLDRSLQQVELLMPDDYKDEYRTGLTQCKHAAVGVKNNCEAAHKLLLCLRGQIEHFIFP